MSSSEKEHTSGTRASSSDISEKPKSKTSRKSHKKKKRGSKDTRTSRKSEGLKKTTTFLAVPEYHEDTTLESSATNPSINPSISISASPSPADIEALIEASAAVEFSANEDPQTRATRRARGKSVYLTCFVGFDIIYFLIRLIVFLRIDIFHDAWQTNMKRNNDTQPAIATDGSELFFCGDSGLEAQCAWIFSLTWLFYFLAIVSLILSIIRLSLKICYAYVFLKTTSIILHFLGLFTFGSSCLSQKFYIETGIFFVFHLPLQIFGTKRTKNYAMSLKRAEMEKAEAALSIPPEVVAAGLRAGSPPRSPDNRSINSSSKASKGKKLNKKASPRRKSFMLVTTVDE